METIKKPFDKKRWRNERYNKKFQKQQYEEKKNKAIMRNYYKKVKKGEFNKSNSFNQSNQDTQGQTVPPKRINAYQKAQLEFEKRKQEKLQRKEEAIKKREEIKEALSKYKENKKKKVAIIRKKTKKGQPIMKERMEMLYEKIKKTVGTE